MRLRRPGVVAATLLLGLGPVTCSDGPDRTVAVEARDFGYGGLESFAGAAGETVEFEMTNAGPAEHELVLIDPDGTVIGGVPRTPPGKTGRVTVELEKPGTYTFACFVDDHLSRGMTGTLTVS